MEFDDIWGDEGGMALRLTPADNGAVRFEVLRVGMDSRVEVVAGVTVAGFRLSRVMAMLSPAIRANIDDPPVSDATLERVADAFGRQLADPPALVNGGPARDALDDGR